MQPVGVLAQVAHFARSLSLALMICFAAFCVGATVLAAAGFLPWLTFTARFDAFDVTQAGMIVQITFAVLMVALCFFVPAANRMLALERSHRNFRISMEDIEAAYRAAHAADRGGVFRAKHEFDGVRERMEYLRNHPELHMLEADLLTVASQMGEKSQRLAQVYSTKNLERAKTFLEQRQQEIDTFTQRLETARALTDDLKHWHQRQQTEEGIQQAQVERLQRELLDLMPELGFDLEDDDAPANVVLLSQKPTPHKTH